MAGKKKDPNAEVIIEKGDKRILQPSGWARRFLTSMREQNVEAHEELKQHHHRAVARKSKRQLKGGVPHEKRVVK